MSPAHTPRHLLVWSLPTVAVILSFLWYKRRKDSVRAESDGIDPDTSTRLSEPVPDLTHPEKPSPKSPVVTGNSKPVGYSRSLSGVDSAPIDIKTSRSVPLIISDKELDLEIEKIKSMKAGASVKKHVSHMAASPVKRKSPKTSSTRSVSNGSAGSHNTSIDGDEIRRGRSIDRDSANHSPTEAMMPTSPSLSSISDNHSDSDSGKGGSEVATPPPIPKQQQSNIEQSALAGAAKDIADVDISIYEFIIPQQLVGRLIGRHGAFVHHIREKTNARILIKRHPDAGSKLKVCSVEGTPSEVDAALAMIRDKFPTKRYPELTLDRMSFIPVVPDCMYLRLVEGVNNDTIVSCVVTPQHLFLQQPTHPTFPSLNVLSDYMHACYGDATSQAPHPPLLDPVQEGTICAAYSSGAWYRTSIVSVDNESSTACVQFLDYGGYSSVSFSELHQIRGDFLLLPFQAAECMLANVELLSGNESDEEGWSQEAFDAVVELTRGAVVFTQVVDYLQEDGVTPLVHIYVRPSPEHRSCVLLNRVLVDRGFARWIDHTAR